MPSSFSVIWSGLRHALWLVATAAAACSPSPRPPPTLLEVRPAQVSRRLDTTVSLLGDNLLGTASVEIDSRRAPTIDADFEVYLGGAAVPPERVHWVDRTRIEVVIAATTPAATYDLQVVLPDGSSAELAAALEVSDEPYGLNISIEDQPAGAGKPIEGLVLATGTEQLLFAVLRNGAGTFAGEISADWQLEPNLGQLAPGPAASSVLFAERVGEVYVAASHPVANDGRVGPIEIHETDASVGEPGLGADAGVGVQPGVAAAVFLETASGGSGTRLIDLSLTTDDTLRLFAVARDAEGRYVRDAIGRFSFSGSLPGLVPSKGTAIASALSRPGAGQVRFEHATLGVVELGLGVDAGRANWLSVSPDKASLDADSTELQFVVDLALDSDGNPTTDLGELTWSIGQGEISSIDPATGRLLPVAAGVGRVRVDSSYGAFDETGLIAIAPGELATLSLNLPALSVTTDDAAFVPSVEGRDADGNLTNELGSLAWSVASGKIGNMDSVSGLFEPTRVGVGTLRVRSNLGPEAESLSLTVQAGRAAALAVSPQSVSLSADAAPFDFVASGTDADGNATLDLGTLVWSVHSGSIASLDPDTGRFNPTTPGFSEVQVSSSYGPTQVVGLIVVAPGRAASLSLQPTTATLTEGDASLAFSVSARDADGNLTEDIGTLSWSVVDGALDSLDPTLGVLDPNAPGSGRVRVESSYGPVVSSETIEIRSGSAALGADLLGDRTPVAQVLGFDGQLLLGPSNDGTRFVRSATPEGPWQEAALSLSGFATASNSADSVFPSIGSAGCAEDTVACGPDNEDGRGVAASGTLAGSEWLALGGARSDGDMAFVYLAPAGGAGLDFRPVDIGDALGGQTRGLSAMHFFGDRLYLGFADTGGSRPYFVVLANSPPPQGLNASEGTDVFNLEGQDLPGFATPGNAIIDAITDFRDRLYVANAGGWVRSTRSQPDPYDDAPGHWASALPSAAEYAAHASVTTPKTAGLEPRDRAVPAMVGVGPLLYAARNTVAGPQLWLCDPTLTGSDVGCDPPDWQLCAPNTLGDASLSQFDNPNNAAVSLLAASDARLYIGFDNAVDGAVVFRGSFSGACAASDFAGDGGCSAADPPGACPGLASNGFGDGVPRIFDAAVVSAGNGPELLVTAGDGVGPVHLYRLNQ